MTLEQLDADFAAFARKKAEAVAPVMTWDEPDLPASADSKAIETWLEAHPKSFPGLRRLARQLVAEANWPKAKEAIARLKAAYPDYLGEDNAYVLLAAVCQLMQAAIALLGSEDTNDTPDPEGKARPGTIRQFEEYLREGGFSQRDATTVALHGFKALTTPGEPDEAVIAHLAERFDRLAASFNTNT